MPGQCRLEALISDDQDSIAPELAPATEGGCGAVTLTIKRRATTAARGEKGARIGDTATFAFIPEERDVTFPPDERGVMSVGSMVPAHDRRRWMTTPLP